MLPHIKTFFAVLLLLCFSQHANCFIKDDLFDKILKTNGSAYHGVFSHIDFSTDWSDYLTSDLLLSLSATNDNLEKSQCFKDFQKILGHGIKNVAKYWDSFAIPGTGFLEGHLVYLGQSEECINAKKGYFAISVDNFPDTEPFLLQLDYVLTLMVCMPSSCSNDEVAQMFQQVFREMTGNSANTTVSALRGSPKFEVTAAYVIAMVVFGSIAGLVALATLVYFLEVAAEKYKEAFLVELYPERTELEVNDNEGEQNEENKDKVMQDRDTAEKEKPKPKKRHILYRLLMCFNFYTNFKKIITIPKTDSNSQIGALNGIRVMSLGWVIVGHTVFLMTGCADNLAYLLYDGRRFLFQTLTNGTTSVDTFFVLSGMLVMYGSLKALERKRTDYDVMFWIMFYVHRIIRLWPTLLLAILFVVGIYPNLAHFFFLPIFQPTDLSDRCTGSKWWATAFFYNNGDNAGTSCLGWTWYVANDMQFYLISPIFILLTRRAKRFGVAAVSLFVFGSSLIILIATIVVNAPPAGNGLPLLANPQLLNANYQTGNKWVSSRLYFSSYCRFQTYGVGLLLGLVVYERLWVKRQLKRLSFNVRLIVICLMWFSAFILAGVALYGVYPTVNGHPMGPGATAMYNATFRLLWSYGISVLILFCCLGYGGLVNDILSANFWIPFARVNYTTYIIHFILIEMYYQSIEQTLRYTVSYYVLLASGMVMCINCLSIVLSCFIEAPFIQLEKVAFGR